jgi:superfamily II DNA or RNA helicase
VSSPIPTENTMTLLPFQASLVDAIVSSSGSRIIWVRADVGLGKSTAIAAAATRLMHREAIARVLVLCPAALRDQWAELLLRNGVRSLVVDRFKFREMLEAASDSELWPIGMALVLGDDFARQPDILKSLTATSWDLVVADEAHQFSGIRGTLLKSIATKAERVVLATVPGIAVAKGFPWDSAAVVDWQRDGLLNTEGGRLNAAPPFVNEIFVESSEEEEHLSQLVEELCNALEPAAPMANYTINKEVLSADIEWLSRPPSTVSKKSFFRPSLTNSLHSSPSALENALRRLTLGGAEGGEIMTFVQNEDTTDATGPIEIDTGPRARVIAKKALEALEAVQIDSKLGSLAKLLEQLTRGGAPKKICVLTNYLSTLYYLAAELEEQAISFVLLHGSMGRDTRHEAWRRFEDAGGVLVATRAMMNEGLNLSNVTDLVLYDLPNNKLALLQIIGGFDPLSRVGRLTIHVLASNGSNAARQGEVLDLLREIGRVSGN